VTCPGPDATGLGAYVLGALGVDDRRRVEEHLGTCAECAAELMEFRGLPALLARVRPEDLRPVTVAPSADLYARTVAAVDPGGPRLRTRARARTWALVAAAVLAVLGIGAGVTVWATGSGEQSAVAEAGPVRVAVTAIPEQNGVSLDVTVAGLRPGEICHLVAVDRAGERYPAGKWPASDAGDGRWVGWADLESSAVAGIDLLGDGGRKLAYVSF
jgi:hypothetical protein